MSNDEKLFFVAHNMQKFVGVLNQVKESINKLDGDEFANELQRYSASNDGRKFFINKCIRRAYEPLYQFLAKNGTDNNICLAMFLSLYSYNLSWDSICDVINLQNQHELFMNNDVTGEKVEMSSVFNILADYKQNRKLDIDFLRLIRNGMSHSKFDYDFEKKTIVIKMRNNSFVVEVPTEAVLLLPMNLYRIYDQMFFPNPANDDETQSQNSTNINNNAEILENNKETMVVLIRPNKDNHDKDAAEIMMKMFCEAGTITDIANGLSEVFCVNLKNSSNDDEESFARRLTQFSAVIHNVQRMSSLVTDLDKFKDKPQEQLKQIDRFLHECQNIQPNMSLMSKYLLTRYQHRKNKTDDYFQPIAFDPHEKVKLLNDGAHEFNLLMMALHATITDDDTFMQAVEKVCDWFNMKITNVKKADVYRDLCNSNKFMAAVLEGMMADEIGKLAHYKLGDPLYYSQILLNMMIMPMFDKEVGISKFRNDIINNKTYAMMEEICDFANRAYANFICNYLIEKYGTPDVLRESLASDYFVSNEHTTNHSVYDIFQSRENMAYVRNCLIHPEFLEFDNGVYKLTDRDKNGNIAFHGEITQENLEKLISDVLDGMETSCRQER